MSDVTITEERATELAEHWEAGADRGKKGLAAPSDHGLRGMELDQLVRGISRNEDTAKLIREALRHRAQAGWVPVSERLPTAAGFYLVTGSTDEGVPFVWTSSFTPNIGTKHPPYWSANEVIAWQELRFPAPYKVTP